MTYAKQAAAAHTTAKLTLQVISVRDDFMINMRFGKRNAACWILMQIGTDTPVCTVFGLVQNGTY